MQPSLEQDVRMAPMWPLQWQLFLFIHPGAKSEFLPLPHFSQRFVPTTVTNLQVKYSSGGIPVKATQLLASRNTLIL